MISLSSLANRFAVPANRLYRLRDRMLKHGQKIVDLVSGNVTANGVQFPMPILKRALAEAAAQAKIYKPDPLGQRVAREAISRYYAKEGLKIPAEQIVLTPGTSVSYLYAFKLLADSGDEILSPSPSYPLFDSIAAIADIKLVPYRLREAERWEIDFDQMESAITAMTKAVILISPHNPTGAVATQEEIQKLADIATRHHLAIISDEVFSPFVFRARIQRPACSKAPLVITLNGFSKMFALPGMKLGWMGITGEASLVKKALRALDMLSDTFLPVNEIAQFTVPRIFKDGQHFLQKYRKTIQHRAESVCRLMQGVQGVSWIPPEGGFYVTVRLDRKGLDEEEVACELLKRYRLLVHPGYFYDMDGQHIVMSLIHSPQAFRKVIRFFQGLYR